MSLNPYEIVQALYEEWQEHNVRSHGYSAATFADAVVKRCKAVRGAYFSGPRTGDYEKGLTQLAYVVKRFPTAVPEVAFYLDMALSKGQSLKRVLAPTGKLNLLALGAGPGCEVVGTACYLNDNPGNRPREVGLVCVDKASWKIGYDGLKKHAMRIGRGSYVEDFFNSLVLDVPVGADIADPASVAIVGKHAAWANLVTLRLVASENLADPGRLVAGIEALARHFRNGTTIIFMDIPDGSAVELMKACAKRISDAHGSGAVVLHEESAKDGDHLHQHGGYKCDKNFAALFQKRGFPLTFRCICCGLVLELT